MSRFSLSSSFLVSILSSQGDPPTFKNLDFALAGARFLKNRRVRSEDGLESVLGLSWASFGRSWGSLGGLLSSSGVSLGISWGLLGGQGTILGSSWVLLGASWGPPALFWPDLGGLWEVSREPCWPLTLPWDRFWWSWKPPGSNVDALPNDMELHNWLRRASTTYVCLLLLLLPILVAC